MADRLNPNDPFGPGTPGEMYRRDPASIDHNLRPDPELAEGPANGGRIAIFALGIAIVLGAVFYGLNNGATPPDAAKTATSAPVNTPPANNMADSGPSKPPVPPGVRDVTPSSNQNAQPGVTTGSARPQPPANAPTATDSDRSRNGTK